MPEEYTDPKQFTELLAATPFHSVKIEQISEGNANFSFRAFCDNPDGKYDTVFIKHAEPYIAKWKAFKFEAERNHFEYTVLSHLINFQTSYQNVSVTSPKPLLHIKEHNTTIYEDVKQARTLKTALVNDELDAGNAGKIGGALGKYLAELHRWGIQLEQEPLRQVLRNYTVSTKVLFNFTYEQLAGVIDAFPEILAGQQDLFAEAKAFGSKVFFDQSEKCNTITHGDFWTGNVLIPNVLGKSETSSPDATLYVLDWEATRLCSPGFDIGQMVAEMYLPHHFHSNPVSHLLIQSFLSTYARSVENATQHAMTAATHFGMHLLVFPAQTGWPKDKIEECIKMGLEYLRAGIKQDTEWVRQSLFGSLWI
ncbi:kinase-like domain-containing protein [Phlyctochytrium arcticum]|nr:kinase-like domain-containing protein [Phlyctochytrium arcticum]